MDFAVLWFAGITQVGMKAVAHATAANTTLKELDVSWNGAAELGGITFGEMLTKNSTLQRLNLSNNRLTHPSAIVIAEALRMNQALTSIDLSCNPIGADAAAAVVAAGNGHSCLKEFHLKGTLATRPASMAAAGYQRFDVDNPEGHYRLDLEQEWGHALAELLRRRAIEGGAFVSAVWAVVAARCSRWRAGVQAAGG